MSRADIVGRVRSSKAPQEIETDDDGNLYVTIAAGIAGLALDATIDAANVLLTAISDQLPASLGAKTSAASLSVVPATDAAFGTVGGALDETLTNGTQLAIMRSGLVGASVAAIISSTANGADHQAADVAEQFAPAAEDNTNGVIATHHKPVAVSTYAWSVDQSAALEASTVTKASAGVMRKVFGRIDSSAGSATYYVQALNAASLPADGAVTHIVAPKKVVHTTGTDSPFEIDLTTNGVHASTGLVVCLSSTEFTKTIAGAYLSLSVLYK